MCIYFIINISHPYPLKEVLNPVKPTAGTEKGKKKWGRSCFLLV